MRTIAALLVSCSAAFPQTLGDRALDYLVNLIRLETANPPGNETRAARYLKKIADAEGIPNELLGDDPNRLSFLARLKGTGELRPLLIMAHTDVVPADPTQWTSPPFAANIRDGVLYGRGAEDTLQLVAAEMAVMVELKRRGVKLKRDIIFLGESDEEAGSTAIQWIVKNAWHKIDAEFALNEAGYNVPVKSGSRLFFVQTSEKVPTRIKLIARGTAGHGSLPRADNPVVHLARAIDKIASAEMPVKFDTTTRRMFEELVKVPEYAQLAMAIPMIEKGSTMVVREIGKRNMGLASILSTTVSPTMLAAGTKINVIPNIAEAQIDIRRLPSETQEEIHDRMRKLINDPAVEVAPAGGQQMPATEPSSLTSALYKTMESVLLAAHPNGRVIPYMTSGGTDGAFLRDRGMAVYGVPFFEQEAGGHLHGNDERISISNLARGTELLLKVVTEVSR